MPASAPTPNPAKNHANPLILLSSAIRKFSFSYARIIGPAFAYCFAGLHRECHAVPETPSIPQTCRDRVILWRPFGPDTRPAMPSPHWTPVDSEVLQVVASAEDDLTLMPLIHHGDRDYFVPLPGSINAPANSRALVVVSRTKNRKGRSSNT